MLLSGVSVVDGTGFGLGDPVRQALERAGFPTRLQPAAVALADAAAGPAACAVLLVPGRLSSPPPAGSDMFTALSRAGDATPSGRRLVLVCCLLDRDRSRVATWATGAPGRNATELLLGSGWSRELTRPGPGGRGPMP
jgi:hypothetical protein